MKVSRVYNIIWMYCCYLNKRTIQWIKMFKDRDFNWNDRKLSGRPSTIKEANLSQQNSRYTRKKLPIYWKYHINPLLYIYVNSRIIREKFDWALHFNLHTLFWKLFIFKVNGYWLWEMVIITFDNVIRKKHWSGRLQSPLTIAINNHQSSIAS